MRARPVIEFGDWLYVVRSTFTRGPNAHDFDSDARSLSQSLRHARAIVITIHHGNVRTHETKRPPVDYETAIRSLHKTRPAATSTAAPTGNQKQNCRARNECQRGQEQ